MKTKPFDAILVKPGDEVMIDGRPEPRYYVGMTRGGKVVTERGNGVTGEWEPAQVSIPDNSPPKIVPYTDATIPLDAWFQRKDGSSARLRINAVWDDRVWMNKSAYTFEELLDFNRVERDRNGKWFIVGPAGTEESC